MTYPYISDDAEELYALQDEYAARRDKAERLMRKTDSEDGRHAKLYEIAEAAYEEATKVLREVNPRIEEIEDWAGLRDENRMRREYYGSVL